MTPSELVDVLADVYGEPSLRPSDDPLAELILTVLSQNTSDSNSGRAFAALMARFGSWDEVMDAQPDELVATIRGGGLAQQKAPRIQAILRELRARGCDWSLAPLRELPLKEATPWLTSLPGVGPKTAACVLLFGLGRPALPVDTHVERVGKRLGLVPENATAEKAQAHLVSEVEERLFYPFHMLLIKHGRRTCKARNPLCSECRLAAVCPSSQA